MAPPRLWGAAVLLLGVPGLLLPCGARAASSHSLRFLYTALSEPVQGLPQFVQLGYVDDQRIDLNDSTRQELPQVPRMELHADYRWPWDRQSQAPWNTKRVFLENLATLQKYYSQSGGLHTLQWMFGCELRSDGSKGGAFQFGYDGRDYLSLHKETLTWTAADAKAQLTKWKWEKDPAIAQRFKAYLEGECIEWLRRYLAYGKETLQRTEPPKVKVTRQKSTTEDVETLVCRAHGFYPKEIEATWTRAGESREQETFRNHVAPNPDGTYYIWLYIDVEPEERGLYRCRVAHAGLSQPLVLGLEEPEGNVGIIVAAVIGAVLAVLILGIIIIFIKKRRTNISHMQPSQEQGDSKLLERQPRRKQPVLPRWSTSNQALQGTCACP